MTPIKQITLTLLAFLFAAVSLHAADRDAELRSATREVFPPCGISKRRLVRLLEFNFYLSKL